MFLELGRARAGIGFGAPKMSESTAAPPNIGPRPGGKSHCLHYRAGGGYEWLNSRHQKGNPRLGRSGSKDRLRRLAEEFRRNRRIRAIHRVTDKEMEMLSRVALMGDITSVDDLLLILGTTRGAREQN